LNLRPLESLFCFFFNDESQVLNLRPLFPLFSFFFDDESQVLNLRPLFPLLSFFFDDERQKKVRKVRNDQTRGEDRFMVRRTLISLFEKGGPGQRAHFRALRHKFEKSEIAAGRGADPGSDNSDADRQGSSDTDALQS
jgi:hypothetical protein